MKKDKRLDLIRPYVLKYPDKKNTKLADLILKENPDLDLSHRSIRHYIGLEKDRIEESPNAPVPTATLEPTIALEDILSCAYSRNGLNYSKPQITAVLDIDPSKFDAIASRIQLNKYSPPLGPESRNKLSEQEQKDLIGEITKYLLDQFVQNDNVTVQTTIREYKKKVMDLSTAEMFKDDTLKAVVDALPKVQKLKVVPYTTDASQRAQVIITDPHIGMKTHNFNYEIAKGKVNYLIQEINQFVEANKISEVDLVILGDIPHTVSGLNHLNVWKDIEPDFWGADALTKPFELLLHLVSNITNIKRIKSVGGNHGRLHSSKELEPSDEGEKLIMYMLDKATPDELTVDFDSDRMIFDSNNLRYICLHGDQGLDKKSGQEIAWLYGTPDKYNLILLGHLHTRIIGKNDDGKNFRKITCPAFAPTDHYAERLGVTAASGFFIVREGDGGFPRIEDIPLYY